MADAKEIRHSHDGKRIKIIKKNATVKIYNEVKYWLFPFFRYRTENISKKNILVGSYIYDYDNIISNKNKLINAYLPEIYKEGKNEKSHES